MGKVFDPTTVNLPVGCLEFAQSPHALKFEDFVRVFFSTRSADSDGGKYRSHIAFVDMDKSFQSVIRVSSNEVIPLGALGTFDEHGIFPMSLLRHGDAIYGYTTGWSRRVSVSVETAIGLAVSHDDGVSFQRAGPGPILAASLHEPFLVGDGFVLLIGDTFHMWYIFGVGWRRYEPEVPADRIYKIGHAVSANGIAWVKDEARQIVPDLLGPEESQALPTVIEIQGRYHMFFCYRQSFDFRANVDRGYRIGHAYSDDLRVWSREDDASLQGTPGDWDSDMQCYPHVFECDGRVFLLYNGNEFGRFGFGLAVLETVMP